MILDGAAIAERSVSVNAADPRSLLLACHPASSIPPLTHVVATATPLVARINHGVWIASCSCGAKGMPSPGCVVFLDQLVGWCVRCGNQGWGGGWRPVVAPGPAERALIEAVLLCRPNVGDRNWESSETLADLIAQNREHGDPVPPEDEPPAAAPVPVPNGPRWPTAAGRALLRAARRSRSLGRR